MIQKIRSMYKHQRITASYHHSYLYVKNASVSALIGLASLLRAFKIVKNLTRSASKFLAIFSNFSLSSRSKFPAPDNEGVSHQI